MKRYLPLALAIFVAAMITGCGSSSDASNTDVKVDESQPSKFGMGNSKAGAPGGEGGGTSKATPQSSSQ